MARRNQSSATKFPTAFAAITACAAVWGGQAHAISQSARRTRLHALDPHAALDGHRLRLELAVVLQYRALAKALKPGPSPQRPNRSKRTAPRRVPVRRRRREAARGGARRREAARGRGGERRREAGERRSALNAEMAENTARGTTRSKLLLTEVRRTGQCRRTGVVRSSTRIVWWPEIAARPITDEYLSIQGHGRACAMPCRASATPSRTSNSRAWPAGLSAPGCGP
jgi:hypothetical protein